MFDKLEQELRIFPPTDQSHHEIRSHRLLVKHQLRNKEKYGLDGYDGFFYIFPEKIFFAHKEGSFDDRSNKRQHRNWRETENVTK